MHKDQDILLEQSQKYFYCDCSIRAYRSFCTILLAVFDAVFIYGFSCDTARKCVNFEVIIPEDHPYYSGIIPDSF